MGRIRLRWYWRALVPHFPFYPIRREPEWIQGEGYEEHTPVIGIGWRLPWSVSFERNEPDCLWRWVLWLGPLSLWGMTPPELFPQPVEVSPEERERRAADNRRLQETALVMAQGLKESMNRHIKEEVLEAAQIISPAAAAAGLDELEVLDVLNAARQERYGDWLKCTTGTPEERGA